MPSFFQGQKSLKAKPVGCQTAVYQCRHKGCGSGEGLYFYIMPDAFPYQQEGGVRNAGGTCIGYHGHFFTGSQLVYQVLYNLVFIMLVVGREGLCDLVVVEQVRCIARVFRQDQVHFLQHLQRTQRDVL